MDNASPQLASRELREGESYSEYRERISKKEGYRVAIYWVTGDVYRGEWSDDKRHGTGTHLYKSGNRYEGQFLEGRREGHGTFWVIDKDTNTYRPTYRGHWKDNLWHGTGLLYGLMGEIYVGSFECGKRSGCGKQTYREWMDEKESYHVYNGEWADDQRNGIGTLTMVNGNVYIGHWVDDVKEGLGVFYYKDKQSKYEGVWKRDVPVCGTYTRDVKWDPFEDMDDVLQLPPLEVANFQKLARECISAAWRKPLAMPFEHFTSAVFDRPEGTPGPLDHLIQKAIASAPPTPGEHYCRPPVDTQLLITPAIPWPVPKEDSPSSSPTPEDGPCITPTPILDPEGGSVPIVPAARATWSPTLDSGLDFVPPAAVASRATWSPSLDSESPLPQTTSSPRTNWSPTLERTSPAAPSPIPVSARSNSAPTLPTTPGDSGPAAARAHSTQL